MPRKRITHSRLYQLGACADQRALFRKHYPKGALLTIATARKAARLGLDLAWLVEHLPVTDEAYRTYVKAITTAHKKYMKIENRLYQMYDRCNAQAFKKAENKQVQSRQQYNKAISKLVSTTEDTPDVANLPAYQTYISAYQHITQELIDTLKRIKHTHNRMLMRARKAFNMSIAPFALEAIRSTLCPPPKKSRR